jgi:putative transposase
VKFAFVAAEKARGEFKVTELCSALRVSTSGFCAWCKREPSTRSKKDEQLKVLIKASFDESRKTYGSPRIHEDCSKPARRSGAIASSG